MPDPRDKPIAFIGLGVMGKPMAENLLRTGYEVLAHTRTRARGESLLAAGARWADSAAAAAAEADTVITMLPDGVEVARVAPDIVMATSPGAVWIDMSTIEPHVARTVAGEAAARGIDFLDAPVSGGERGAVDGTLSIMVGGDEAVFARCHEFFDVLGKNVVLVGDVGAGQVAKACNQLLVGCGIAAVAEALTLASAAGVDPARVREALLGGFAASRVLEVHGQRMLDGAHEPGFRIVLHRKDFSIIEDTARRAVAPVPVAALAAQLFTAAISEGNGDRDHSAVIQVYRALAGQSSGVGD